MRDVIGGLSDGDKLTLWSGTAGVYIELKGEPYIALEFPIDEKDKKRTVTIYMRCGMTPLDAMTIWRERNMTNPAYESYKVLVDKLLAARPEEIEAEGKENFAEYCEKAREQILAEREWPNRLTLATALGIKAADAREGRISAGIKKASMPAHTRKKESREKSRSPAESFPDDQFPNKAERANNPDPYGQAAALPVPGNLPNDPDDAPW